MIPLLLNITMELNIHKAFRNGTKTHYKKCIYVFKMIDIISPVQMMGRW